VLGRALRRSRSLQRPCAAGGGAGRRLSMGNAHVRQ
jgi:hypothetical protein